MRIVEIDASDWTNPSDLAQALKEALGSCEGHGSSPDAFVDSMIYGGMNCVEPPYKVKIVGSENAPSDVRAYITLLAEVIRDARAWKLTHYGTDTEVSIELVNPD
ncbi:MAG: hypothetical protein U1E21_22955 [Reyranellaceae bacterium]